MTLKKVKELIQITTDSEFKRNKISTNFGVKYNNKNITIQYLTLNDSTGNLTSFREFFRNNKITNIRLIKKGKEIVIEEKPKFNPSNIEKKSEEGSVWIFNRALVDNVIYTSADDILNDEKFHELEKIFDGNVGYEWVVSFYKQQEKFLKQFGRTEWKKFKYGSDDDFMDFIKDVLSEVTLDNKKIKYRNWNPTDIWMIKKGSEINVKEFIRKNINRSSRSQTIYELNALLRMLIRKKELIGLSLKKVGKGNAKFIYVNINISTEDAINENVENIKSLKNVVLNLSLNNNEFKDQQAKVTLVTGKDIQIKPQSPNRKTNLAFETLIRGSGGRGGKAPVEMAIDLLPQNKTFKNDFDSYPKNTVEFLKDEQKYSKMYDEIKFKVTTHVNTKNEFIENMKTAFNSSDEKTRLLATYKLMELNFLYDAFRSSNPIELFTDIYYLGLKKGKTFAPHGKLY
jgi:hypothetical protein